MRLAMELQQLIPRVCTNLRTSRRLLSSKAISVASAAAASDSSLSPPTAEPTIGPIYWERRRAEWLKQGSDQLQTSDPHHQNQSTTTTATASNARARLEALLAAPGAEEDDLIWNDAVNAIWKGLVRGDRLKRNLPLPIVVSQFACIYFIESIEYTLLMCDYR